MSLEGFTGRVLPTLVRLGKGFPVVPDRCPPLWGAQVAGLVSGEVILASCPAIPARLGHWSPQSNGTGRPLDAPWCLRLSCMPVPPLPVCTSTKLVSTGSRRRRHTPKSCQNDLISTSGWSGHGSPSSLLLKDSWALHPTPAVVESWHCHGNCRDVTEAVMQSWHRHGNRRDVTEAVVES